MASKQFESIIAFILQNEGGSKVTMDPNDRGGLTKFGISQRAYPDLDIEDLTLEQAKTIYKRDYYDKIWADSLPYGLALVFVDFAVNAGVRTAVKVLQTLVGSKPDGIFGSKTQAEIKNLDVDGLDRLIDAFTLKRNAHYLALARQDPANATFIRGWLNRSNAAASAAHKGLV